MSIPMFQCLCSPCGGGCSCDCHRPWPSHAGPVAKGFVIDQVDVAPTGDEVRKLTLWSAERMLRELMKDIEDALRNEENKLKEPEEK